MRTIAIAFAATTLMLPGCGKAEVPDRSTVTGIVMYQGKPVPFGRVIFTSTTDQMLEDGCDIKSDGSYCLTNAPVGKVKIRIQINGAYDLQAYQQRGETPPPDVLPKDVGKKYAFFETTPLEYVVEVGEKKHDIEIKRKHDIVIKD